MRTDKLNMWIKKVLGNNAKKIIIKLMYPWRNNFVLFNVSNRAKKNCVNLNYWDESNNLGDTLSPVIVNHMLSLKGISPDKCVKEKKHLYAVGSVLTAGIQDATVWGSGILNATLTYRLANRKFDIRAVRGPFTRAILIDYGYTAPDIYGDPAIIMPEIYNPDNVVKTHKYGVIMHKDYIVNESENAAIYNSYTKVLNIKTDDYKFFIEELKSVEIVISSSLHGIILAEVYGVPAILLKPQVDILKYYDYYYGTGRMHFPIANTVSEAHHLKPADIPDFTNMVNQLKETFPYDMYM